MSRRLLFGGCVLAAAVAACRGERREPAPTTAAPTTATPTAPPAPTAPTPSAPTPPPRPAPPLPSVTIGPALRLPPLPLGKRVVGRRAVPTVELADPIARGQLDVLLARDAAGLDRCRVLLALATLVSMRCVDPDGGSQGAVTEWMSFHYAIGADGAVAHVDVEDVLHPGTKLDTLMAVWLGDPAAAVGGIAVLTPTGLELDRIASDDPLRFAWRTLAPHVRADGPLGAVLRAHGLPLAAVGATAAPVPPRAPAIVAADASSLFVDAWRLPTALRATLRVYTSAGGDEAMALVAAPGTDRAELVRHLEPRRVREAFAIEPTATLGLARAREALELRTQVGAAEPPLRLVPRGAVVLAALGAVAGTSSSLGRGWTLVGGVGGRAGWTRGRGLVADASCVPVVPPVAGETLELVGVSPEAAWTVAIGAAPGAQIVTLYASPGLTDCLVGAPTRRLVVDGVVADLLTAADGSVVVVTAPSPDSPRRAELTFGPDGDTPLARRDP